MAAGLELRQTASDGENVSFTVSVNAAPNEVGAFGFDIRYNADALRYKDHARGDLVQKRFKFFSANELSPGHLRVGGIEIGKNRIQQGDTGSLVILNFEKIGDGKHGMALEGLEDGFGQWTAK